MGIAAAETIIAWQSHEGLRIARAGGHDIIQCTMCGFRHVVPLPEPRAFEHTYRDVYARASAPDASFAVERRSQLVGNRPADLLESFERLLGPSRRRLLDIGSGPGFFLRTAKARGWRVLGIEPSRTASTHARGLGVEVAEGFFNAETAPGLGRYDVIQLNNVLEHVPYPTETLLLAREMLEPGGVLCVNVPNDFSPLQVAARVASGLPEWWVAPNRHLNYFDFDSAERSIGAVGFRAGRANDELPDGNVSPDGRELHGRSRAGPRLSRQAPALRSRARFHRHEGDAPRFLRTLANVGFGREAIVIAVKP